MKYFKTIAILFLFTSLFFACKKEKTNWDINASLPLANGKLTISDLVGDSMVEVDNGSGEVSIVYHKQFYDLSNDSLYQIPDTTIENKLDLPFSINVGPGQSFYSKNNTASYDLNGVELNYGRIEHGTITVKIVSSINEKTVVDFTAPSFSINNKQLHLKAYIDGASNGKDITYSKQFDVSGYNLDLTGPSNNSVNTIYSNIIAKVSDSAKNNVQISAGSPIKVYFILSDISPYYIQGYFGNRKIHLSADTMQLEILNNIQSGNLDLDNALVDINLKNGAGIDAQFTLNNLIANNSQTAHQVSLQNNIIGKPIVIKRAQKRNGTPPVRYTYNDIHLDKNNSNTTQFIENLPNEIFYDLDLEIDPLGNVSSGNDFLYKDYPLQADLNIKIPMNLSISNLLLVDTFKLNLKDQKQMDRIKGAKIFADIRNGFPLEAGLSLRFLDDQNNLLFSTGFNNVIQAGDTLGTGAVNATENHLFMLIDKEQVKKLQDAQKIVLKIKFNTIPKNKKIIFYQKYFMDIDLYADFIYNIEG